MTIVLLSPLPVTPLYGRTLTANSAAGALVLLALGGLVAGRAGAGGREAALLREGQLAVGLGAALLVALLHAGRTVLKHTPHRSDK
jgi:DMSO reductase anchor subunit